MNRRFLSSALLALMVFALLAGTFGCAGNTQQQTTQNSPEPTKAGTATDDPDSEPEATKEPLGKYDPAITLTTVFSDANRTYPAGQTSRMRVMLDAFYKNPDDLIEVAQAVENKDPSGLSELKIMYYDRCMKYLDGDLNEYGIYGVMGPGGSCETIHEANLDNLFEINKYYGPNTDTMNQKMRGLKSKFIETITKVIMEGNVDAEFDAWLDYWNTQGGTEITQEVNDWYESQ